MNREVQTRNPGAGAAPGGKEGGPSPIREIESLLREVRIEIRGPSDAYQKLADTLFEAVDQLVKLIVESYGLKLTNCDEEPTDITYASGIGFSWTATTWCVGVVKGYHVIAESTTGYNGDTAKAILERIEVKSDENER
jgi:hypothetical protein